MKFTKEQKKVMGMMAPTVAFLMGFPVLHFLGVTPWEVLTFGPLIVFVVLMVLNWRPWGLIIVCVVLILLNWRPWE